MDPLNQRVLRLIDLLGLSKSIFASHLGISLPLISHITSGRNKPGVDMLQKILIIYPQVNPLWLLLGEGDWQVTSVQTDHAELKKQLSLLELKLMQLKMESEAMLKLTETIKDNLK